MKIAIAHNRYQQAGGEDKVVAAEAAMLSRQGHDVESLIFDNETISGAWTKAATAISSFYSWSAHRRIVQALDSFRPDVLHIHNFMPTLSPSVFFAARQAGVPVVQTLHNYRLLCANAQLFREGGVCESCVEQRSFLPGVRHACYRDSYVGSAVVGGTMALHALLGTWTDRVARYIVLSEFAAAKLGEFRVPAEKIRVKPNFVVDHGTGDGGGDFGLFVGRLSHEKGLGTLIAADRLQSLPFPIRIAGDGPMRAAVERACGREGSRLIYAGPQTEAGVRRLMKAAHVLLAPSLWYEGFPMVMVEALSLGLPVIASNIGGLPEIVEHQVCGLLHTPGNADALIEALNTFDHMTAAQTTSIRYAARQRYVQRYGEPANYEMLSAVYSEAIGMFGPP